MPINYNMRFTPKYAPAQGLAQMSGAFAESVQNFGKFFENFIQQKRQRAFQLGQMVNKLEEEAPLFEANQQEANQKIQELQEYIGELKRQNKQKGVFRDWTDEDLIAISAKATKLQKEFAITKQDEKAITGFRDTAIKNPDKFDTEQTLNWYLRYRETKEKPPNEEWLKAMPNNFMEELDKVTSRRKPIDEFVRYENGKELWRRTYKGVDESTKRNDLAGMFADPRNREGADLMMRQKGEYDNYLDAAVEGKVSPEELWAYNTFGKEMYKDQYYYKEAPKDVRSPKEEQQRWSISDNIIGAGGRRGKGVIFAKDEKVQIPIDLARKLTGQKLDSETGFVSVKPEILLDGKIQGVITEPTTTKRKYLTEDEAGAYGNKRRIENVPKPKADWDNEEKKAYRKDGTIPMNELYYIEETTGGKPITVEVDLQEISPYMYSSMPGLEDFLRNNNMNVNARSTTEQFVKFEVNGKRYKIPVNEAERFIKKYPNAIRVDSGGYKIPNL